MCYRSRESWPQLMQEMLLGNRSSLACSFHPAEIETGRVVAPPRMSRNSRILLLRVCSHLLHLPTPVSRDAGHGLVTA